jgi:hypothetical protein
VPKPNLAGQVERVKKTLWAAERAYINDPVAMVTAAALIVLWDQQNRHRQRSEDRYRGNTYKCSGFHGRLLG